MEKRLPEIYKNQEEQRKQTEGVADTVVDAVCGVGEVVCEALSHVGGAVGATFEVVGSILGAIGD